MSEHAATHDEPEHGGGGHEGHGAGHAHNPHVHHHFDTEQQQFDSDKLGMWLFLSTEILLFAGLFCAYAVYRANHPEMFKFAHLFLDVKWGFINTLILLFSSFTMAWAVRAAQLGQKKLLVPLLAITVLCGFGFLGVKTIEYKAKFEHGTTWGKTYKVKRHAVEEHLDEETKDVLEEEGKLDKFAAGDEGGGEHAAAVEGEGTAPVAAAAKPAPDPNAPVVVQETANIVATSAPPAPPAGAPPTYIARDPQGRLLVDRSKVALAAAGPGGLAYVPTPERIGTRWSSHVEQVKPGEHPKWKGDIPDNPQVFFSIYFMMTGLHGIHVIIGMICITVVLIMSAQGKYGADYMTPIDLVGLYWHLVDLIWIFLFPLLYLIH
jgi:cytochrome c oxidase subunit 3